MRAILAERSREPKVFGGSRQASRRKPSAGATVDPLPFREGDKQ
jgi:hypothetical protein